MTATVANTEILGLTADSRRVEPGWLFAAIPGTRYDGRDYIDEAVSRGASAVLAPAGTRLKDYGRAIALIEDSQPRRALAQMAATFHGRQPRTIAAVTGTNGKTSVASFTRQLWELLGWPAASLGTLGLVPPRADAPKALTTPDPVELARCLADLETAGFEHLCMEASSHGLDQFRLDGVRLSAAAFTNLSRDHLDYHGTMAGYLAAKKRLFAELLPEGGTAVLNADVPEFEELGALCRGRGQRVIAYGRDGADLRLKALAPESGRLVLTLEVLGKEVTVALPVAGTFQAWNALAALGLVLAEPAVAPCQAVAALEKLSGVPGRVELVGSTPAGGLVYVDYAHTPDAIETVLKAVRPHTAGRLLVVFGAGGDRDPGKRPLMGEAAVANADLAIVTDDNPRSEPPAAIRAQVLVAAPGALEVGDRRKAIEQAVALLEPGDALVIAGKGHEAGQIVGDRVLPFDDRLVAADAIARLGSGAPTGGRA
ncbi:UDP-N-acetylmuramoylalanyl-D-glutamate--2,6-diaminopimelate ligase [Tistlia consotensis]|uniref:UDP-N-acetylmuramoyl-L-alanyl-D-glutamate--2,6-diaminopimelate ligase n=1 Tax=Tistlia consotensis USBA 355 TaxID=560819 RepID=A0A1Y6CR20_9PROT|nr:UDP-N-acetylmuramoyl-L-alanyl-D-glutamate--2,6-diaminopimelate ligase [Tistlia consotensis]SMF71003.1 UDP-N-acetylmuramoylalanyl-D-glutamate--2,6-diaminopimelate ligase [Tistlia consotensis USBA 355]SNS07069.1 UDP-N-acetylmuramoylalanyl-D-glutamate--2,6-diaminopimelate ligase [Tistlia consotensis]